MIKTILAVALLLALSLACSSEPEKVTMGTEGYYHPYNFINDDGEVDGFERELGDELCRRADLECVWVTNDWDTIIPNLNAGNYDTIMAGMSITDERDELIDFTDPYFPPSPSVYLALAGAGDEAANGKIAVQEATIQSDYLSGSSASMVEYKLAQEPIAAVLNGDADAALVDSGFAHDKIAETGQRLAIVGPEVPIDNGIGVGLREDDSGLKDKLDSAIADMKKDGSLNDLIEKWFGPDADTF